MDRVEDVLLHNVLLAQAKISKTQPVFNVRLLEVLSLAIKFCIYWYFLSFAAPNQSPWFFSFYKYQWLRGSHLSSGTCLGGCELSGISGHCCIADSFGSTKSCLLPSLTFLQLFQISDQNPDRNVPGKRYEPLMHNLAISWKTWIWKLERI